MARTSDRLPHEPERVHGGLAAGSSRGAAGGGGGGTERATAELAREVLDAFGWRAEPVEPNGAIYVGGGQQAAETSPPTSLVRTATRTRQTSRSSRGGQTDR